MTVIIKPNDSKAEIEKQLKKLKPGKGFNTKKYFGKIKWGQDAVEYQRELRED